MPWGTRTIGRDLLSFLGVDATFFSANVSVRPIPYGVLGHYRGTNVCKILAAQAVSSRLFTLRNNGTNLIILTRLNLRWLQNAAHTAAIEGRVDVYRLTGFTVSDTTNTITPIVSLKKTGMAAAPGGGQLRAVQVAGLAAGMTGGTLTKDGGPFHQHPKWLLLAQPTAGDVPVSMTEACDDNKDGRHPFIFAQNEGISVENAVLLGAAAGSNLYLDFEYVEVAAYPY